MSSERQPGELLVVFVKYPEPGRVKTRLAAGIGASEAVAAYREFVDATLEAVGGWAHQNEAGEGPRAPHSVWIYYDPQEKQVDIQAWLEPVVGGWRMPPHWLPQPEGGLGEKLQSIFHQGFKNGFSAICAIGTDCPALTAQVLEQAFSQLGHSEGVVGPTPDGGYYLIGIKSEHPDLFHNIPWSSSKTLSATREVAERLGLRMAVLPVLEDVDTEAEWRRWRRAVERI